MSIESPEHAVSPVRMPHELEAAAEWRAADVADPAAWTLRLDDADHAELEAALAHAKAKSTDPLELGRGDFPLDRLAPKLEGIVDVLLNGRGFARIATLDVDRYGDEDLTLLYWGIGLHLGEPWAQNKHGHVLGDVTDQGKTVDDPTVRGNELGGIALDYHTDGSDLVGLLCLRTARIGGLSCVANAVAIHNRMVRESPELAAALYEPMPYDTRGEQAERRVRLLHRAGLHRARRKALRSLHPAVHPGLAAPHRRPAPEPHGPGGDRADDRRSPTTPTSTSTWTCSRARCSSSTTTTCCTAARPTRTTWRTGTSGTSSDSGWPPTR